MGGRQCKTLASTFPRPDRPVMLLNARGWDLTHVRTRLTHCGTPWQVYLMLRQMTLKMEHAETQRALLERGRGIRDDDSRATPCQRLLEAAQQHWLLLAVLVPYNLIHPLPGVTGLVEIEQLGMEPKYRVEALIAGAMLLRVYHIFYLYQVPHSFPGCWHQHLVYQVLMPVAEALCWFGGEASPVASQTFSPSNSSRW